MAGYGLHQDQYSIGFFKFRSGEGNLGVADDGDTVEEALANVRGAIKAYRESLIQMDGRLRNFTIQRNDPEGSLV